jgi:hypothetical protein
MKILRFGSTAGHRREKSQLAAFAKHGSRIHHLLVAGDAKGFALSQRLSPDTAARLQQGPHLAGGAYFGWQRECLAGGADRLSQAGKEFQLYLHDGLSKAIPRKE